MTNSPDQGSRHTGDPVLAEIEQMSYAEIAKIEQTTCGTVKSRINRAKQRLRAAIKPTMREN